MKNLKKALLTGFLCLATTPLAALELDCNEAELTNSPEDNNNIYLFEITKKCTVKYTNQFDFAALSQVLQDDLKQNSSEFKLDPASSANKKKIEITHKVVKPAGKMKMVADVQLDHGKKYVSYFYKVKNFLKAEGNTKYTKSSKNYTVFQKTNANQMRLAIRVAVDVERPSFALFEGLFIKEASKGIKQDADLIAQQFAKHIKKSLETPQT